MLTCMTGSLFLTDSRIRPSGDVVISLFEPAQKLPPWIYTITGRRALAFVPCGLAIFRFKQSSEILVIFVKDKGTFKLPRGWGQAGPYESA